MNILPKKRWHVRTKENIARVRKDEAEAAEKEQQEIQRIENADREARLSVLKQKTRDKLERAGFEEPSALLIEQEHINLFSDLEQAIKTTNTEHEREVKEKKEEYEKQIGYLTYLGQDTNEALGKKNWYEVVPESSRYTRASNIKETYNKLVLKDKDGVPQIDQTDIKDGEIAWKAKQRYDPLNMFRKYKDRDHIKSKREERPSHKKLDATVQKHKIKRHKHEKEDDKLQRLKKLRDARLKRKQEEKRKTQIFLCGLNGSTTNTSQETDSSQKIKPKYNSQFNPELARQNYM